MEKMKNQICYRKGEKENGGFLKREKIKKNEMVEEGGKIKYEITTSLISR
jgi:hypothetical protein